MRAEVERINREVPGVRLTVIDDSARFIERSINAVKEHVMIGSVLVIVVIFLFLRNFRSTLIVCTSIPISVIGTFALLYFSGLTLNTMTFGGLALGVGMVVDAAIVVLENSFRHMEHHGKDRLTASIDGSEEVWSAILASILTHIAVFVPLLFLTGVSSIMFRQLSVVVVFSLLMSLFVAVTLVPVLCSKLLVLPPPPDQRRGLGGWLYTLSERALDAMDDGYRRLIHLALAHRPTRRSPLSVASVVAAVLILPTIPTEFSTQADEGQVNVQRRDWRSARASSGPTPSWQRLEQMLPQLVPEADDRSSSAAAAAGAGVRTGRRRPPRATCSSCCRRRTSGSDRASRLRWSCGGSCRGCRASSSARTPSAATIRWPGFSRAATTTAAGSRSKSAAKTSATRAGSPWARRTLMDDTPGVADARVGRDEGRPELAVRVDRPKAALLGLTVDRHREHDPHQRRRHAGRDVPRARKRIPDHRPAARGGTAAGDRRAGRARQHHGRARCCPAKNLMTRRERDRTGADRAQEPAAHRHRQRRARGDAERRREGRAGAGCRSLACRRTSTSGSAPKSRNRPRRSTSCEWCSFWRCVLVYAVMASQYESLRDPFIIMFSVPTAAIGVVLALKLTGTAFNMQAYIGIIMLAGIVVSNGILLVDYTNVLRRRDGAAAARGRRARRPHPAAADSHDVDCDGARPRADVARHRRRQRAAGAARPRGDWRA